ncbi:flavodoxin family protein [Streptomyces griseus]|uniref:flavodoxin family protein n=1 Tax=Streptomyces griseus TaxID=1911 RepID=UPI00099D2791|nr:NAD(P)H-dependent oxidoreductase [Streptomyces griseus]
MSRRFLFLLGSHRSNGNTELLARQAAAQLPADIEQQWISLAEHPLPYFDDLRHGEGHATRPEEGNLALLFEATLAATDIPIASPVYWYSLSSHTKRYLDTWTSWLYTSGLDFRATTAGRTLWGVTTSAGGLPWLAEPLVSTINNRAAYMQMNLGGVLRGNGTAPGDVLKDTDAPARAKTFFPDRRLQSAPHLLHARRGPAPAGQGPPVSPWRDRLPRRHRGP